MMEAERVQLEGPSLPIQDQGYTGVGSSTDFMQAGDPGSAAGESDPCGWPSYTDLIEPQESNEDKSLGDTLAVAPFPVTAP